MSQVRTSAGRTPRRRSVRARRELAAAGALSAAVILVSALAVWLPAAAQRRNSERIFIQTRAADHMLTAMLDQETGLRGYALTRETQFLEPYRMGRVEFDAALASAHTAAGTDGPLNGSVDAAESVAREWQVAAEAAVTAAKRTSKIDVDAALRRKSTMDRYRLRIADTMQLIDARRRAAERRAQVVPVIAITVLSALFLILGHLVILRPRLRVEARNRLDRLYAQGQQEFSETMQMAGSEEEAHTLLKRHLERTLPGTEAIVLKRNNSENRLELGTEPHEPHVAELVIDTDARSCLAIRYGRTHGEGPDSQPLLSCALCRSLGDRDTTCVPSLVGGQVIGSVLVVHDEPLDDEAQARVRESVVQAGPVLANLRTLARAERRAATDALTGLPNARAVQDTLTRMGAQAARANSPLTAIMIDLDRFKALNDDFGHQSGNDVLAAVARALEGGLRTSDFIGRYGGEEFVALLPDTDRDGGLEVAEKLRVTLARLTVPGVPRAVTASFGVATLPDDAPDAVALMRQADRALYRAKELGRNRVECLAQSDNGAITLPGPSSPVP